MGGAALADGIDPVSIQKNSSLQTVQGLVNSMVGGTMLLLPTLTLQAGFMTTVILMAISCIVSYITCAIFTKHMKLSELDIQWSIKRILGRKWYAFFVIICTIYLFFLCQLYYVLIVQMLYSIICFGLFKAHVDPDHYVSIEEADYTFTFNKFSEQWVMVGTFFIIFAMLFIKKLNILVKIAEVGVFAIYSYVIFVFYCFGSNFDNIKANTEPINYFSANFGNLAGTASLAFTIHTSFGNMIKCNKNQRKNVRDLGWTYIIGYLIYTIIAIIGGIGIINRPAYVKEGKTASMITQYFPPGNYGPLVVQTLYFGHLISVLPIFFDIMKRRFLPLVLGTKQPSNKLNFYLNLGFMLLSVAIKCIPGIQPDDITNFNGALCCFFFVYLIPIVMHLVCYHGNNSFLKRMQRTVSHWTEHGDHNHEHRHESEFEYESAVPEEGRGLTQDSMPDLQNKNRSFETAQNTYNNSNKNEDSKKQALLQNQMVQQKESEEENEPHAYQEDDSEHERRQKRIESCADHGNEVEGKSFALRLTFYSIIMILGLCILVYGIYTIVLGFIHKGPDADNI